MSTLDIYNNIESTLKGLYLCTEKQEIEVVFDKNNITDYQDRIDLLQKCMGVEETFYTPGQSDTVKDGYDIEIAVFVEGSWRLVA